MSNTHDGPGVGQEKVSELLEGISQNAGWAIAIGALIAVAGFLAIGCPLIAGLSVTIAVGMLLGLSGVAHLTLAFRAGSFGRGALIFALGAISLAAGVSMVFEPFKGLLSLTLVLAIYFFVSGVTDAIAAFGMRGAQGWFWALISGIASIVLGGLIWSQFPLSGDWAVGVLAGIRMIFGGMSLVAIGSGVRGMAKAGAEAT